MAQEASTERVRDVEPPHSVLSIPPLAAAGKGANLRGCRCFGSDATIRLGVQVAR